jgi:flavin-dependent dehydrogenase
MKIATDVLVIGGGPAGSSAALTLAEADISTLICEAGTYPRAKVCGEFYSPECTQLLGQLGLNNLLAECHARRIDSVHLTASNGMKWNTTLPGTAWGLSRNAFDNALAQRAMQRSVELWQGTTVCEVTGNLEQGFDIEVRNAQGKTDVVHTRAVIAAHGKRSVLDRKWNREFLNHGQTFIGLKSHFVGPSVSGRVTLHAFNGGYCGLAEIETGLVNVSLLVNEYLFRAVLKQSTLPPLQTFVYWMRGQNAHLDDWFARAKQAESGWHGIGQVSFESKHPVVDDVLMAGDAAGLIAPLAGDGIAMALQSGMMAGRACADYLNNHRSPEQLKEHYGSAWQREFSKRLKLAQVLQKCMLHPRLFALALTLFKVAPVIGQQVIQHTRAVQSQEAIV